MVGSVAPGTIKRDCGEVGSFDRLRMSGILVGMTVGIFASILKRTESDQANSSYKSRHPVLVFSIIRIFQARFHTFIAFSRNMALSIVSCASYHTKVCIP